MPDTPRNFCGRTRREFLWQVGGDEQPERFHARRSSARSMWSVTVVVRSRTSPRPPGRRTTRSSASVALETEMQTVPTGLASEPPPGPAIPVIPMPYSASRRERAPAASCPR